MKSSKILIVFIFFAFLHNVSAQLTVKDQDPKEQHTLLQINDEGFGGSLTIPSIDEIKEPNVKLYNLLGTLYWNGSALGCSNVGSLNDLSDAKYDGSSLFLGEGAGGISDDGENFNTAVGGHALYSNTSGSINTASGYRALYSNTTGHHNTANGISALYSNTSGNYNTANGPGALYHNTIGSNNTASGCEALYNNREGDYNTASGHGALHSNTTGNHNTANGHGALCWDETGNYNTAIGFYAAQFVNGLSNTTCLGNGASVSSSNQVRIGNSSVTSIGGCQDWTTISDIRYKQNVKEDVGGLDFILGLRPITYNLNVSAIANKLGEDIRIDENGNKVSEQPSKQILASRSEKESVRQTGFAAQEVEELANRLGYDFSGIDKPENLDNFYGLRYAEFVVPLVKAMQEQQEIITKQEELIAKMDKRLRDLESNKDN